MQAKIENKVMQINDRLSYWILCATKIVVNAATGRITWRNKRINKKVDYEDTIYGLLKDDTDSDNDARSVDKDKEVSDADKDGEQNDVD